VMKEVPSLLVVSIVNTPIKWIKRNSNELKGIQMN
jgi:hypothetical protein